MVTNWRLIRCGATLITVLSFALFYHALVEEFSGSIVFDLESSNDEYYVDELVLLTCRLYNNTNYDMKVGRWLGGTDVLGWHFSDIRAPDFSLKVFYEGREELLHSGLYFDFPESFSWRLPPNRWFEKVAILNEIYDLSRPGRYVARVTYFPSVDRKRDGLVADILARRSVSTREIVFSVRSWNPAAIEKVRQRASNGDLGAVHLLGTYRDISSIPILSRLVSLEQARMRLEAARALGRICTSESIGIIGGSAVRESVEPVKVMMVDWLIDSQSPSAIPWLKEMLDDTVAQDVSRWPGKPAIRRYHVREAAARYLRSLGYDIDVVYEEELSEEESQELERDMQKAFLKDKVLDR